MGVMASLENDPILSGRSIQSFRHLELQNPSIISDFRHRSRMVQEFQSRSSSSSRRRSRRILLLKKRITRVVVCKIIRIYTMEFWLPRIIAHKVFP